MAGNEVKIRIKAKDESKGELKKAEDNAKATTSKISKFFNGMSTNILSGVRSMARFTATVASAASLVGPAVSGILAMGHAVALLGTSLVAMAPAATVLPGLAASIGFIALTVKAAVPGIQAGLKPIGDAFATVSARVAVLAGQGLPDLARQFVKVNMPTIAGDMEWIARSVNAIVTNTMHWINSAAGQDAIRVIADSSAEAFERLVKPLDHVVQSFGNLIGRVSGNAIGGIADMIGRAADASARWMDSIGPAQVAGATAAIKGYGEKAKDAWDILKGAVEWMSSHQGVIKAFSDSMAIVGISLGAATGNVPAILAGVFSLASNHWGLIKGLYTQGRDYIMGVWDSIRNDPNVQAIWEGVESAVKAMVSSFKENLPAIEDAWKTYTRNLKTAWDQWGPVIAAWWESSGKPIFSALGAALGIAVIAILTFGQMAATGLQVAATAFRFLWTVVSTYLGFIINAAAVAFGWIPGIGPKLTNAANDFNNFAAKVNGALSSIHDKHVSITVEEIRRTSTVNVPAQDFYHGLASGGVFGGASRAASGGPRNNLTLVGEHGPELVNLRPGTMVTPAGKTRSMMSAGGGQSSVNLTINSGGSMLDDMLCEVLRKAISRRGGNVQTVLGDA